MVLERLAGAPTITNDGVSIAREIELTDQFKNMGAQLVREVANKTSELTGDGTTTATLLAQAIVREGMQALEDGANPMLLRRGIEEASERLSAELRAGGGGEGEGAGGHVSTVRPTRPGRTGGAPKAAVGVRRARGAVNRTPPLTRRAPGCRGPGAARRRGRPSRR